MVLVILSVAFHGDVPEYALHTVIIAVLLKGREGVFIPVLSASTRKPVHERGLNHRYTDMQLGNFTHLYSSQCP